MTVVRFTVEFMGECPTGFAVGDKLKIGGTVTVSAIKGELVEITSYGDKGAEFTMGALTVDLYANRLDVENT